MAKSTLVSYNVRDLTREKAYSISETVGKVWDLMREKDAKAAEAKALLN